MLPLIVVVVALFSSALSLPVVITPERFVCYIAEPPQVPIKCAAFTDGTIDSPPTPIPLDGLDIVKNASWKSSASPGPIAIAASVALVCVLRTDRSLSCVNPRSSVPSTLSELCPVTNSTEPVYQCGTGRLSSDGGGWIGSAYGDDRVSSTSAEGFVSVNAASVQSTDALYLLTSPHRYPTSFRVAEDQRWNVSRSPTEPISRYCIPPRLVDNSTYGIIRAIRPISQQVDVLHTSMQSICVQSETGPLGTMLVVCGLTLKGSVICWGNTTLKDYPLVISPPVWLHFSEVACASILVCGIISNPSLSGRLFCWSTTVIGSSPSALALTWQMSIWEVMVLANTADLSVRQAMMKEWTDDEMSRRCQVAMNTTGVSPPRTEFPTVESYYRSHAYATTTELNSASPFISVAAVLSKPAITLLSANGLTMYASWLSYQYESSGLSVQPVVTSSFPVASAILYSSTVSAGVILPLVVHDDTSIHVWSGENYIPTMTSGYAIGNHLDSDAFSALFMPTVDTVCGLIQSYPDASRDGQIRCYSGQIGSFPSTLAAINGSRTRQYQTVLYFPTVGPFGEPLDGVCLQHKQDKNVWDCNNMLAAANTLHMDNMSMVLKVANNAILALNKSTPSKFTDNNAGDTVTNIFCYAYRSGTQNPLLPYPPSTIWRGHDIYANSTMCTNIPRSGTYNELAGNANFACALSKSGSIVCWGQPWFTSWASVFNPSQPSPIILFGNVWRAQNLTLSVFDTPYEVLSAPAAYTYSQLCTATIFACGLTTNGSIICWSGIYGNGSRMVMWSAQSIQPDYPVNSPYTVGILIPDWTSYDNITFTQVRCSAFSVCGLTANGSVLCSGVPLPTATPHRSSTNPPFLHVTSQNYIVDNEQTNPPLADIGSMHFDRGQYCAITLYDRSIRCNPASRLNGKIAPSAAGLAPIGRYRMGGGTELFRCPGNTYSTRRGAVSSACDGPCKAGYAGRNTSKPFSNELCGGLCSPGHYCVLGNDGPSPCAAGLYGTTSGLTNSECTSVCPSGSYCPEGSVSPLRCPAGTFGASAGLTNATCSGLCRAGYVCPLGSTSPTQNPCQVNTYNLLDGSLQCLSCNGLDVLDCGGGIITISRSVHASIRLTKSNNNSVSVELMTQPCPLGFCVGIADSVTSRVNMSAVALYADSHSNTPMLLPLTLQCGSHHDQSIHSPLCGYCVEGFALSTTGACEPCNSISWIKVMLYICIPWLIVIIFYVLAHGHGGTLGVLLYFVQTIVIMLNNETSSWLYSFLSIIGFSPLSLIDNQHCIGRMSVEMYFALPIFIPAMQLMQLAVTIFIHAMLKRRCVSSHRHCAVLDESSMCYVIPDGHDNRYNSIKWYAYEIFAFRLWPELTVATIARTVVLTAMASFTSTAFVSMSWFDCSGTGMNGDHVIWSFPVISCYTVSYWRWSILYLLILFFWATIFMVMAICVWRYRQFISAVQATSMSTWKHINAASSNRLVPLMVSSVALVRIPAVLTSPPSSWNKEKTMSLWLWSWYWPFRTEADETGRVDMQLPVTRLSPSSESVNASTNSVESRLSYAFRSVYSAIWDSYTPQAVGWMIVIWLRRLLLLIISVALSLQPKWKFLCFSGLHLAALFVHNAYQPYALPIANQMEQVSITVHLLMAIILAADVPDMTGNLEQYVLAALTVFPIVALLIITCFRHLRLRPRREQVPRPVSLSSLSSFTYERINEPLLSQL